MPGCQDEVWCEGRRGLRELQSGERRECKLMRLVHISPVCNLVPYHSAPCRLINIVWTWCALSPAASVVYHVRMEEWSSYVAPKSPKEGLKNAKRPISVKIAFRFKIVCYKVSLYENSQRQSCKAVIGLTNRAKMIGGGDPFYLKFWIKVTALEQNRRFSIFIRS